MAPPRSKPRGDKTKALLVSLRDVTETEKAAVLALLAKHDALDLADMLGLEASDAH